MAPPSSFASAAAGNNANNTPSRTESSGEWARRTNGATQTFRRPSVATNLPSSNNNNNNNNNSSSGSSSSRDAPSSQNAPAGVYVPPHRNGSYVDTRYSKNQLLDLFKSKQDSEGSLSEALPNLFVGGWQPEVANGVPVGGWSRDQPKEHQPGPEICWEKDGVVAPVGLVEMDDEEKELFTSVNSPLKPPATTNKENVREQAPSRKISISQSVNSPGGFGLNSPSATRPGTRRKETQEYPFPTSALASPSLEKSERSVPRATSPPAALTRRRTGFKDEPLAAKGESSEDKAADDAAENARTPFGTLKRNATAPLSAGLGAPSSPWAATPQNTTFSPMGAFGNFALGAGAAAGTPTEKRPGLSGGRTESRFKGLLSKDVSEDGRSLKEKPSLGNLGKVDESGAWRAWPDQSQGNLGEGAEEDLPTGSAALSGEQDVSPPRSRDVRGGGLGTPSRQDSRDDFGFAAFGMAPDASFRGLLQEQYHGTPSGRGQPPQQHGGNEPMSPTDTNPYQSPEHHAQPDDIDSNGSDIQNAHLPGLGGFVNEGMPGIGGFGNLGNLGRVPGAPPSDRSQTSSVTGHRGFGLGGLGAIPGLGSASAWGGAPGAIGTPNRERAGLATNFGDNVFGSGAEIQSPSLAGLGQHSLFSSHNMAPGSGRGSSRLGSLFPQAMQEQMRSAHGQQQQQQQQQQQHHEEEGSDNGDFRHQAGLPRDTDSPFNVNRQDPFGQLGTQTPPVTSQDPVGARSMQAQPVSSSASNQPPAAQQKTMVMPDRMRWIYRDPQGVTQGPWSGLEMHDWYKAGFFSPELLVKKYEDQDYEPLAQLIRRIGNSREPFLVPQIGIPHGPPSTSSGPSWTGPLQAPSGAQPPFANSFPSFGTTLTADQQNALERRKQEEQYLMARQKEHLAQQQIAARVQQYGGLPLLHHHSSAHSLHSQPSFGNITSLTSPSTFQPSPLQAPTQGPQQVPGFFDNSFRSAPLGGLGANMLGNIGEEELPGMLERLNTGRQGPVPFGGIGQPIGQNDQHSQQVASMLHDRSRLQQEQAQHDAAQRFRPDQAAGNDRLQQFQTLQTGARADPFGVSQETSGAKPIAPPEHAEAAQASAVQAEQQQEEVQDEPASTKKAAEQGAGAPGTKLQEPLSLTEQVQKAASAQETPAPASPWNKIDTTLPQPFPPAPSQSPLPAPAAQRNRSGVADALHAESRSRSQTPSVDTPSIAPWAKEPAEAPRGPSLKEIQEAEAKVAAEAEALAAAQRRAQLEQEIAAQAQAAAPQPGLPSSANWASASGSPATPSSAAAAAAAAVSSAWGAKAAKPTSSTPAAKSMAQIQKEEEARKKRVAAAQAAAVQNTVLAGAAAAASANAAGKRYADLASKVAGSPTPGSPSAAVGSSAWTTVGASGKVKTPAPTPAQMRTVSAGPPAAAPGVAAPAPVAVKKAAVARTAAQPAINAMDEFKKWAANELRPDLKKNVNADEFVANLLDFPHETGLLTEAVHGVSNTIDSRHFAEEFIRRRKLADKGQIDTSIVKSSSPASAGANSNGGGWSEVAKKGPVRQESKDDVMGGNGAFKVVPSKKRGGKR